MGPPRKRNTGAGGSPGMGLNDFPPHDLDAERALLGSMLLAQDALGLAVEQIKQDDFYDTRHRAVYRVLAKLFDAGSVLDPIIIKRQIEELGLEKETGGMDYVAALLQEVPSAANVRNYVEIVKERSTRRRVLEAATGVGRLVYDPTCPTEDVLDRAEQSFYEIADEEKSGATRHISEVIREVTLYLEKLHNEPVYVTGLPSGFVDLDKLTAGFQPGEFIVIAGRPSMGKTTFALNIVRHMSLEETAGERMPVLFFSLEMTAEQLAQNLLCSYSKVDASLLRIGRTSKEDYERMIDIKAAELYEAPVFIDDQPGLTLSEIRSRARRYSRREGIRAVFVDYLQLARQPFIESREQQVAEISKGLKGLAKDLRIPVIALSQLNRNPDVRPDKRPALSDLRESGSIEQDADVVVLLHRPDYYDATARPGELDVDVAKNRNGPTGMIVLQYARNLMRMESYTRERG